jgi:hypothetical protein
MKHLENYRNNLIKILPSKTSLIWFELYINNISQGDYRSKEDAIETGQYIIDSAIDHLKSIEQNTVIDHNWHDYLKRDKKTLNSILVLTGYEYYQEVLAMFEGLTIEELLNKFN